MSNTITSPLLMTTINQLENKLNNIVELAVKLSIATSCSLSVSFGHKKPAIILHYGKAFNRETDQQSVYDLASLTKILGTTMAIQHAVDRASLRLDETPFACWPHASVRAILAHRAGLPKHVRFYEMLTLSRQNFVQNRAAIFANLFTVEAKERRDERLYSDLGFMALGLLLEKKRALPLAQIFADAWQHSELHTGLTWYPSLPLSYSHENPHIVPTGYCTARGHRVIGQVHDPNCYFMGGLEGHAGLFGTLSDVDHLGRYFLRAVKEAKSHNDSLIRDFARLGLGFDKPTKDGTTRYLSPHAFGHFGYTGTSLWIDPYWPSGQGIVIALLTNRVNVSENPHGIFWLRLAINRALQHYVQSPHSAQ